MEFHEIFSFPNIFHPSIESMDMPIWRVSCIFFSPNIKFLANIYNFKLNSQAFFFFFFALTCHVTYCHEYPEGNSSWQIKEKVWRFSTAFCSVYEWKFADILSMAHHVKKCSYNIVEKQEEAIPLPCMCVMQELTKEGRSLHSVLKPVLSPYRLVQNTE